MRIALANSAKRRKGERVIVAMRRPPLPPPGAAARLLLWQGRSSGDNGQGHDNHCVPVEPVAGSCDGAH